VSPQGIITTVAGNGTQGYSGDGGPATSAQLGDPTGVAVDSQGDLFIADPNNEVVREVNTQGIITTVAGNGTYGYSGDGGPATSAQLRSPQGVAVDSQGDLFITDANNNVVREVSPQGIITTVAGNGTYGYSGDGGPATSAQLNFPYGVAVDSQGDLFIADEFNHAVREVNTQGIITTVAGTGTRGYSGDGGPATSAQLNGPHGVAVDSQGHLLIADEGNSAVREVSPQGIITTVAGNGTQGYSGDGGPATSAQLNSPSGVAVDSQGHLFIADEGNSDVREVSAAGVSAAFGPAGEVLLVTRSDGSLTQYDAAGAHPLGSGVQAASVAFTPAGSEVLDVTYAGGALYQYDAAGAHLVGSGVQSASVAFAPDGSEVFDIIYAGGALYQYDAAGGHYLGTGFQSVGVAYDAAGSEVLDAIYAGGALYQYDAAGAHLVGTGFQSASVAFSPGGSEVLDVLFANGLLERFDATGGHPLGML
jgi:sugar lactone lactonase YvrE